MTFLKKILSSFAILIDHNPAIDESDSFNRRGRKGKPIHKIIRKWVNSLLREGKARFEESNSSLKDFKAIVIRFSGLNAPNEENGIGTQVLKEGLYHYEFAPQKLNGGFESLEPLYITAEEIDDNVDIFVSFRFFVSVISFFRNLVRKN